MKPIKAQIAQASRFSGKIISLLADRIERKINGHFVITGTDACPSCGYERKQSICPTHGRR